MNTDKILQYADRIEKLHMARTVISMKVSVWSLLCGPVELLRALRVG